MLLLPHQCSLEVAAELRVLLGPAEARESACQSGRQRGRQTDRQAGTQAQRHVYTYCIYVSTGWCCGGGKGRAGGELTGSHQLEDLLLCGGEQQPACLRACRSGAVHLCADALADPSADVDLLRRLLGDVLLVHLQRHALAEVGPAKGRVGVRREVQRTNIVNECSTTPFEHIYSSSSSSSSISSQTYYPGS